ncbi:recombinase family protein [Micromonospora aurantiaca]|uniref:recombinase family protein n=1 Tax=Micromonospora aurantiaca (nom. illeg.) TaxID=47850 RepID=UPI0033F59515
MAIRRRAAKYRRISDDREGRELGVTRQDEDLDLLGERLNLDFVADFVDNDISASTKSQKKRPDYQRMLAGARAGEFEVIAAYTSGRLTRRPREHEDLIDLAVQYGIEFAYVRSPSFDLRTAQGRRIARTLAAQDAGEAEEIAERVQRDTLRRAKAGLWHGGSIAPQGYELVHGEKDRVIGLRLHPTQSALLQEGARRLLAGESLYAICNDWNSRGLTTRDGAHWRSSTLRRALLSPSAIAKRAHKDAPGELFDTDWPALLERDTWDRLHDLLGDPKRKFQAIDGSYAGKRAMGGGVSVCDPCGKKLISQRHSRNGQVRLICHRQATGGCGVVTINYALLESFVLDMLLARLDSPEFHAALATKPTDTTDQERALRDELEQLEVQRKRAGQSFVLGIMTEAEAQQAVREVEERQAKISGELASLVASLVVSEVRSADDARKLWASADVSRRRRFVQSFVTEVRVKPWPEGRCSTLTRRKTESEEEFTERKWEHDRETARLRIDIRWRQ